MSKRKKEAIEPRWDDVATVPGILRWLNTVVGEAKLTRAGHKTTLAAALWFCAYHDAQTLAGEATRDLAQALVEGIGPYKTEEHLDDFLDAYRGEDEWRDLLELLEDFWKERSS